MSSRRSQNRYHKRNNSDQKDSLIQEVSKNIELIINEDTNEEGLKKIKDLFRKYMYQEGNIDLFLQTISNIIILKGNSKHKILSLIPEVCALNPKAFFTHVDLILSIFQSCLTDNNSPYFSQISQGFGDTVKILLQELNSDNYNSYNFDSQDENLKNNKNENTPKNLLIVYTKFKQFCLSNIQSSNTGCQVCGTLCLTSFIENCSFNYTNSENLKCIFENLCAQISDPNFMAKLEILNCLISLIFCSEEKYIPFSISTLNLIIEYIHDPEWLIRKFSLNIIFTMLYFCKNEIITQKKLIDSELNLLENEKIIEVREIIDQIKKLIHEETPSNQYNDKIKYLSDGIIDANFSKFSSEEDSNINSGARSKRNEKYGHYVHTQPDLSTNNNCKIQKLNNVTTKIVNDKQIRNKKEGIKSKSNQKRKANNVNSDLNDNYLSKKIFMKIYASNPKLTDSGINTNNLNNLHLNTSNNKKRNNKMRNNNNNLNGNPQLRSTIEKYYGYQKKYNAATLLKKRPKDNFRNKPIISGPYVKSNFRKSNKIDQKQSHLKADSVKIQSARGRNEIGKSTQNNSCTMNDTNSHTLKSKDNAKAQNIPSSSERDSKNGKIHLFSYEKSEYVDDEEKDGKAKAMMIKDYSNDDYNNESASNIYKSNNNILNNNTNNNSNSYNINDKTKTKIQNDKKTKKNEKEQFKKDHLREFSLDKSIGENSINHTNNDPDCILIRKTLGNVSEIDRNNRINKGNRSFFTKNHKFRSKSNIKKNNFSGSTKKKKITKLTKRRNQNYLSSQYQTLQREKIKHNRFKNGLSPSQQLREFSEQHKSFPSLMGTEINKHLKNDDSLNNTINKIKNINDEHQNSKINRSNNFQTNNYKKKVINDSNNNKIRNTRNQKTNKLANRSIENNYINIKNNDNLDSNNDIDNNDNVVEKNIIEKANKNISNSVSYRTKNNNVNGKEEENDSDNEIIQIKSLIESTDNNLNFELISSKEPMESKFMEYKNETSRIINDLKLQVNYLKTTLDNFEESNKQREKLNSQIKENDFVGAFETVIDIGNIQDVYYVLKKYQLSSDQDEIPTYILSGVMKILCEDILSCENLRLVTMFVIKNIIDRKIVFDRGLNKIVYNVFNDLFKKRKELCLIKQDQANILKISNHFLRNGFK